MIDLHKFHLDARASEEKNKKLFTKLKRTKPKDLDKNLHQFHKEAFEKIDCLTCANCCKTTSPIFYQKVNRGASRKQIPISFERV